MLMLNQKNHPDNSEQFETFFLGNSSESLTAYSAAIIATTDILTKYFASQNQPYSGISPTELAAELSKLKICPETG